MHKRGVWVWIQVQPLKSRFLDRPLRQPRPATKNFHWSSQRFCPPTTDADAIPINIIIWLVYGMEFLRKTKEDERERGVEGVLRREIFVAVRGVHANPGTDPPAQTVRSDPKTDQPDAGDGRRRVSFTKNRLGRVGWRVFFFKTRYTRSDRRNPWEKAGVPRSVQIH